MVFVCVFDQLSICNGGGKGQVRYVIYKITPSRDCGSGRKLKMCLSQVFIVSRECLVWDESQYVHSTHIFNTGVKRPTPFGNHRGLNCQYVSTLSRACVGWIHQVPLLLMTRSGWRILLFLGHGPEAPKNRQWKDYESANWCGSVKLWSGKGCWKYQGNADVGRGWRPVGAEKGPAGI